MNEHKQIDWIIEQKKRGRPKKQGGALSNAERQARHRAKKQQSAPKRPRGRPAVKKHFAEFSKQDAWQLLKSIEQRLESYELDYSIIIDIQNLYYFSNYKS